MVRTATEYKITVTGLIGVHSMHFQLQLIDIPNYSLLITTNVSLLIKMIKTILYLVNTSSSVFCEVSLCATEIMRQ